MILMEASMNILIAYDDTFANTAKIAKAAACMASGPRSHGSGLRGDPGAALVSLRRRS